MIVKILAAVIVFVLVVAGFHYADPNHEVANVIVVISAFIGALVAFKYTPKDLL